jgi:protein-tyrosine phosphatase
MVKQDISVLFVCMGNICRSPIAEGVLYWQAACAGLAHRIRIDSAGTHANLIGHAPDPRSRAAAAARGYDLGHLRARQVEQQDFAEFDFILAMDKSNLAALRLILPREHRTKPTLFMDYSIQRAGMDVPDPYYGGPEGFEQVLDMVEDGCAGLLTVIRTKLGG